MNKDKIELIASANWTKISWELLLQSISEIEELLPKVGESYEITLQDSEARYTENGIHKLLWLPPYSELNGLSESPVEVMDDHVIEVELIQGDWIKKASMFDAERIFHVKVLSVKTMIEYQSKIRCSQWDMVSPYFDGFKDVGYFRWQDFYLFTINDQYKQCELLFRCTNDNFYLIFVHDWLSYSYDCLICNNLLDDIQTEFIKKFIKPYNRHDAF